ncbi:unnamed protein product [Enterobius vermicularis]|uniref:Mini-chromosome maintenance complex-binding protein n=1 Tax=Enterobius vermicularis TaxID=51028 RepID=A0A0N4V233_ENTVE|nr:unnamed protein product [Enterobius vermicularis]
MAEIGNVSIEQMRTRLRASENIHNIIDDLFAERIDEYMEDPKKMLEILKEVILPFRKVDSLPDIKTCKSLNLTDADITDGELVRVRCMLKETKGFEVYPMSSKVTGDETKKVSCGLFRSLFDALDDERVKLGTRYIYGIGPVPGASTWYNESFYDVAVTADGTGDCSPSASGGKQKEWRMIAKFLDESSSELKPNHVFDLFGVLDMKEFYEEGTSENSAVYFRSFHVIASEAVVDHKVLNQTFPLISDSNPQALSVVKKSLSLLLGDTSAADYLCCHLISKTYIRAVGNPVCSMAMNIVNVTDTASIIRHIKLLMPKVIVYEVTAEALATDSLIPKMNYDTDVLEDGILQFSSGTVFVIDETKFSRSCLSSVPANKRAILNKNLTVLERLVKQQVFEYDYTHPFNIDSDVNILVLSKNPSCLKLGLPFTLAIPPQFCDGVDPASILQDERTLKECRHTLQVCRNNVEHITLPQGIDKEMTELFVKNRGSGASVEDACNQLHNLLIVTRLLAALDFKFEVDLSHLKEAKDMEEKRVNTLKEFLSKNEEKT